MACSFAALREARTIADERDDVAARAVAERRQGILERKRGRYADAVGWLTAANDSYEAAGDRAGMSCAVADLAEVAQFQGDLTLARVRYDESLALADDVADPTAQHIARATPSRAPRAAAERTRAEGRAFALADALDAVLSSR